MRLKSFYATTMTEAMQMVRDTLGEDAVIVATREERGGAVHVTAAVEPNFELGRGGASDDWLQYDDEDEENAVAEELTEAMLRHSVAEDVMDNIISCATVVGLDDPASAMVASIEHLFRFAPLPSGVAPKAQMMVGMPGSGKTLAVAKMAARAALNDFKVGVISCDTVRAGGVEQLQAFTNILKVELRRAVDPASLKDAIASMKGYDQILVDMAGTNPFDKEDVRKLARFVTVSDMIHPHLVMQAGTDTDESSEIARVFSAVGVQSLVPTRIDMTRRLGGILGAAHHGNLSFADLSNTPKVADGLTVMTPRGLSKLLMPGAFRGATAHNNTKQKASGRH
jgi:flagellar biosynthesis protein FlhF